MLHRRNFLQITGAAAAASVALTSPKRDATAATPAAANPAFTPHGENLAFGRPVKVSSTAYAPTPGFLAVDGSPYSWWTSAPTDPSSIEIDLQAACSLTSLRIAFPQEAGNIPPHPTRWTPSHDVLASYAVAYRVELSADARTWNDVFHTRHGVGGNLTLNFAPQVARYIRLTCTKRSYANYGVGITAIEAYGSCSEPRPRPTGWTAPLAPRQKTTTAQPPRDDGHLTAGWEMVMQGLGLTHADGAAISKAGFDSRRWYEATVPGTVLTTLVNQGVFPDPLFGLNNLQIPEALNKYCWWYRNAFTLPKSYRGKRVWLNFAGINYIADVWLNGQRLGDVRGAFIRGVFDITDIVRQAQTNVLAVKIQPPPHPGLPDEQSWKTGAGFNGGQPARDGPNFFCTIGWDWIPGIRDRCIGIWNHVFLTSTGPVALRNPRVATKLPLPNTSSADISVSTELVNAGNHAVSGVLKGRIADITFQKSVSVPAAQTVIAAFNSHNFPQLLMPHPKLWWPNGYGEQPLYTLELSFEVDGQTSDASTTRFGVRQYEYEKSPALIIKCNGHRIMARGGDWGFDEALKRIPYKSLDAWIRMHQIGNLNIIRNWTGESNSDEFFDLCDNYGIMVWTEFWMANPGDGPDPDNPSMLLANAQDTFKRYRNHPSIVIWCGRNEGPPPAIINAALNNMAQELDGTRYYQPGSSFAGVQSGGPYFYQEPSAYYAPSYNGFKTEIGSVSVPTLDSLKTTMPLDKLWPNHNNTWAYHDYCVNGAMDIRHYEAAMQRRFGHAGNIEEFVQRAQMLNYEVYRGIFEGYMSKLWHNASGVILWMSHPAQHSTVWQLYAHDFEAHASLYGAKKGCEQLHVQLSPVDGSVMVINHGFEPLNAAVVLARVYNLDGSLAGKMQHTLNLAANAKTDAFKLQLPKKLSEVYFVRLQLHDAAGTFISDNFYWHGRKNDNLRAMNRMPDAALAVEVKRAKRLMFAASVTVSNPNRTPAIAIKLTPRKDHAQGPQSRILPAFISDNYFSLMPGESKTVSVEFYAQDAGGAAPMLELSGWNIKPQRFAL
ncbi:MAG: glycosyl hydrolase 2 galactose-binding domain-containing protein [Phycisphaerae bacterium]